MQIKVASYNIHKAVGLDRRRDPDRILAILREIDADVIALQEADRRFGRRESVLPFAAVADHTDYEPVPLPVPARVGSMGWHGNALLVRKGTAVAEVAAVPLPMLEPRGAIRADLVIGGRTVRVIGMHLDLSGIRRRQQVRSILAHLAGCDGPAPAVLMGDLNEWTQRAGCLREFGEDWQVLAPGRSFPARRPVAQLDRIIASADWRVVGAAVHHSALAARGSDHLPVSAVLELPKI